MRRLSTEVEADLIADSPPFTTRLVKHDGKRIQRLDIKSEAMATAARAATNSKPAPAPPASGRWRVWSMGWTTCAWPCAKRS